MRRIILTGATGTLHKELFKYTAPLIGEYARRIGYDSCEVDLNRFGRPSSWEKVPNLIEALEKYDEVLWIDSDVIVNPKAPPIHNSIQERCIQALVVHRTIEGDVPNCGVWYLKKEMIPVLNLIWDSNKFINHPWWENAAILELLGWNISPPCHLQSPSNLWWKTQPLDSCWNSFYWMKNDSAYFRHGAGLPSDIRLDLIRQWYDDVILNLQI